MDETIKAYIDAIADNSATLKTYAIPDYVLNPLIDYEVEYDDSTWDFSNDRVLVERRIDNAVDLGYHLEYHFIQNNGDETTRIFLNGFWKPEDLDDRLESLFTSFKNKFTENNLWNDNDIKKGITKIIKKSKTELEDVMFGMRDNTGRLIDSLFRVKIDYCSEAIRFINNPIIIVQNQVEKKSSKDKSTATKKTLEKPTSLTQNQIVILFHYLKELGILGKGLPKILLAKNISELTGFNNEKIRQDLSHIDKDSNSAESILFSEHDYATVKKTLEKIIAEIQKESKNKF